MAMTQAERQRRYREARETAGPEGHGERRLVSWVGFGVWRALARLARASGKTKRAVLEGLILAADEERLRACETDEEFEGYLDVTH